MQTRFSRINHFLGLGLALVAILLVTGCESTSSNNKGKKEKKGKEASTLRLYVEAVSDGGNKTAAVPIFRANPMPVTIDKVPILDEGNMVDSAVIEAVGGFAIMVKFDFHGQLALESASTARRGSRLVVFSQWTESRWLAAPVMANRITDGVISFTPDCTREEAERIVRGLNNVAISLGNRPKDTNPKLKKKED